MNNSTKVGDYIRICHDGVRGVPRSAWVGNGVGRVKVTYAFHNIIGVDNPLGGIIYVKSWVRCK